jgi:hypothetical protein
LGTKVREGAATLSRMSIPKRQATVSTFWEELNEIA